MTFERITSNPNVLGGKPCVRGTRISVEFILEMFADGASARDIVAAYPHVSLEDVEQAARYAAQFMKNDILVTTGA